MIKNLDKILFMQCRNYGDAVISTAVINSLGKSYEGKTIDVFTRPNFKEIFINNPYIRNIYVSNFPMGTMKNFSVRAAFQLVNQLLIIRKNRYDACINTVGDFRENVIGWASGATHNISLKWQNGHPYKKLIRTGADFSITDYINITNDILNVYDINRLIAEYLGCRSLDAPRIYLSHDAMAKIKTTCNRPIIAIHPFASQECRKWKYSKWKELIIHLLDVFNYEVKIFCAKSELGEIYSEFSSVLYKNSISIYADSISDFLFNLSEATLFIGLDSFAIHAAAALNIPSILINGANDYRVWLPPNSVIVDKINPCKYYPCFNKPKCIGKDYEYCCIDSIEVDDVISCVENVMRSARNYSS